jgi:hypothetical protein
MKLTLQKPDTIGALASVLCVVHCVITPFLFLAHSCSQHSCSATPVWWRSIDYFFLFISLCSVYHSTQSTSKRIMKYLFWINWTVLCFLVINEKFQVVSLSEIFTYVTAFSLALLHIYNLKFCKCKNDKCCSKSL